MTEERLHGATLHEVKHWNSEVLNLSHWAFKPLPVQEIRGGAF